MEETQRYSIAYGGLKNGCHEFRFTVDKSLFEAFESTEIKDGACDVTVDLERAESQLTLDIAIVGEVVVECDRCLEDCRIPIDFDGQLLVKFSDEPREYDGEVIWQLPGETCVDLTQYIYESIVLSLPYQRVHPEGECNPEMLERFRIVSDREFAAIEEQASVREHTDGEWAKLAALRDRMRAEEAAEGTAEEGAGGAAEEGAGGAAEEGAAEEGTAEGAAEEGAADVVTGAAGKGVAADAAVVTEPKTGKEQ